MRLCWIPLVASVACAGDTPGLGTTSTQPVDYDTWTEHSVDGCNGETLAAQTYAREGATAQLLIVPGYTEYTDKYHHMADLTEGRDVDVIVYDHYGQGRSSGVRAHIPDLDGQQVCDLQNIVDALIDPDRPLYLMAHSMGGLITARWLQQGGSADRVILSAPALRLDTDSSGFSYELAKSLAAAGVEAGNAEEPYGEASPRVDCAENTVTHDCERYDLFKDDPLTLIGPTTYGWLNESFQAGDAVVAAASTFPHDVTLFQAGDDKIVVNDIQDQFCTELDAVRPGACGVVTWRGAYHELLQEIERQQVVDAAFQVFER